MDKKKQIEEKAYYKFLERGSQHGQDQQDWFESEKEVNTKSKKSTVKKSKNK